MTSKARKLYLHAKQELLREQSVPSSNYSDNYLSAVKPAVVLQLFADLEAARQIIEDLRSFGSPKSGVYIVG